MSVEALAMVALFSNMTQVEDLHFDGAVLWAASSGGVEVYDTDGDLLATVADIPSRQATTVGTLGERIAVGSIQGGFVWDGDGWNEAGPRKPVVAITENVLVYRDGSAWPMQGFAERVVEAVAWKGRLYGFTSDGRMLSEDREWTLPGPVADVQIVDDEIRIACHIGAAVFDGQSVDFLPIQATAAGEVWGTAEGALVDDAGRRVGGVQAAIDEIRRVEGRWILGTDEGVWAIDSSVERWTQEGPCGNFVTGITRHLDDLVIGTFNQGACRFNGEEWVVVNTPSTMVNDVMSAKGDLWIATAEGLVQVDKALHVEVKDNARRRDAGTNHRGINAISMGPSGLWVADVLGPVRVDRWRRYRWHVSGHSYQAIASCPDGEVWAGSEDDGLAVFGAKVGQKKGRSKWRQFNRFDGLPEDWVMALACAGPGAAYVGTYRNGVGRVDANGWQPVMEDAWVQALLVEGERLWIGTADGLYVAEGDEVQKVRSDDVHSLYRDGDVLWVGTRSGLLGLQEEGAIKL